jgi:hypothetical protein
MLTANEVRTLARKRCQRRHNIEASVLANFLASPRPTVPQQILTLLKLRHVWSGDRMDPVAGYEFITSGLKAAPADSESAGARTQSSRSQESR